MNAPQLDVSVVLPTYNESLSLPVIVPRILRALQDAGLQGEVIVVDDDSPDDTAKVAQELAREHRVRVHKRVNERGLGTAVLHGFSMSEAPVCVVMDADGSHPVQALPNMVRMIQQDKADIVVGSRHVEGGGSRDWPVFSQLKSKFAATLAFGVTSMSDPTTGFMALRRSLLPNLRLDPIGWKIVLEIVVKAAPVRVAEVPIVFTDRELGESKQSLRVFVQYLAHLSKLYAHRYPSLAELAMFCLVGVLGLMVDMSTVIALKELLSLDTRLCAVAGFSVAVTTNFILNRRYTFAHGRELPLLFSYVTYVGTNLAGLGLRVVAIELLIALAGIDQGRGYLVTNLVGIALATLLNFIGAKYFAFDPGRMQAQADEGPSSAAAAAQAQRALTVPVVLLLLAGTALAAWRGVVNTELRASEEGVNVTMAQNMRESFELVVRPSVFPGGRGDWLHDDLPHLGNLPFYPWLVSLMPPSLGLRGMALWSLLSLMTTVFFTARLCALVDPRAGVLCALLMASSPAFTAAFTAIRFEPTLTAFCAAGFYYFVAGAWNQRRLLCLLGGALLGLGFLTKMWLIVPYAFAVACFCGAEASNVRRTGQSLGLRRNFAALCIGFVVTGGAHLVFVTANSPQDLEHWLSSVYLSLLSGEGVTALKLAGGELSSLQPRSALYYPMTLYRDHFYLLPMVVFGLGETLRTSQARSIRVVAALVGACLSVVVLSVPAVKQPAYVLAVQPFLYALAALSLAALARSVLKTRPANEALVRTGMFIAVASALVVVVLWLTSWNDAVSGTYAATHALGAVLVTVLGEAWIQRRSLVNALAACAAVAVVASTAAAHYSPAKSPYPSVAELLRPHLAASDRGQPSFVASEAGVLQGHLGYAGLDAEALIRAGAGALDDPRLVALVLSERAAIDPAARLLLGWCAGHMRERTGELDAAAGRKTGFRVFTR